MSSVIKIIDKLKYEDLVELIDAYFTISPESNLMVWISFKNLRKTYMYTGSIPLFKYGIMERRWLLELYLSDSLNELTGKKLEITNNGFLEELKYGYLHGEIEITGVISFLDNLIYKYKNIADVVEKEPLESTLGITKNTSNYPNGNVKHITYTKNGLLTGEELYFTQDGQIIWRRFWTEGKLDGIEEKYFFLYKYKRDFESKNTKDSKDVKSSNDYKDEIILTPVITNYWIAGKKVSKEDFDKRKKIISNETNIITDLSNIIGGYL
jgi:antitoxin component YwqK of YwqJK toxin-antitoxin module